MPRVLRTIGFAGVVLSSFVTATSQMLVHAVSGTVKSVDQKTKRMEVAIEEGTSGTFTLQSKSSVKLDFDSDLRGDAVDATQFNGVGDFAVIFFYGYGDQRTAVAVKDFGKSGLTKVVGKVTKFDKHDRLLIVKKSDGGTETFQVSDTAVVDTGMGLQSGRRYDPRQGASVRVTASSQGGKNLAVFVRSRR